jgi:hypothetical protein
MRPKYFLKLKCHFFILGLLLLFIALPSAVSAQSKELESTTTLKETLDWIGSKLNDPSFTTAVRTDQVFWVSDAMKQYNFSSSIKECNLTIQSDRDPDPNIIYKLKIAIPFNDIDLSSIKILDQEYRLSNKPTLLMSTASLKKTIRVTGDHYFKNIKTLNPTDNKKSDNLTVYFTNEENRTSFQKAVLKAIKLCGGK